MSLTGCNLQKLVSGNVPQQEEKKQRIRNNEVFLLCNLIVEIIAWMNLSLACNAVMVVLNYSQRQDLRSYTKSAEVA